MRRIVIKPSTLLAALICVALGALAGAVFGNRIESALRYSGNISRAETLALDLVRRAEMAADYAYITIFEFAGLGLGGCNQVVIAQAETALLTKGAVRSVGVLSENDEIMCAAPEAFLPTARNMGRETAGFVPARNEAVSLGRSGELLLVRVRQGRQYILAATSFDTMLYDFLPGAIRDETTARVALTGGDTVSQFGNDAAPSSGETAVLRQFTAASGRYPFTVEIAVPEASLASWGQGSSDHLAYAGGLIGFLVTCLLAALVLRPRTARDDLLNAIVSNQIVPYYQPVFRLDDISLAGCEALVRWIRPDGLWVGPDRFIPLAEAEGLIGQLTLHLAATCARDLGPLCRSRQAFKLSINLPPDLLLTADFIRSLDAVFETERLPRSNIVLEVTERQSLKDAEAVRNTIDVGRKMGFRFALDDTGVGHNGLANVQALQVDFIKIDKCFIDMIDKAPESASIVRMLVSLARDLGKKTVAEGIERSEQLAVLKALGVDEGQGYLIAPALAPDAFLQLASEWTALGRTGQGCGSGAGIATIDAELQMLNHAA